MTNRKTLLQLFEQVTNKAFETMQGKNNDYATEEDALANFRMSEVLNVDPRKALLIRMLDKIKRQVNYIERGSLSVDSAEDDIIDLMNYSVLLHALNVEQEEEYDFTKDIRASSFSMDWDRKFWEDSEYSVRDKVKITNNSTSHKFVIGEIVELIQKTAKDEWLALGNDNVTWLVKEFEFEKI